MAFPWCVMLVPEVEGTERGAVLADAKWPKGSQIKISFLDGDSGLQTRVKAVAEQWITRTDADLTFTWLNDPGAGDIRISFARKGSWSLLGRYAQSRTDKSEPTMNFGWLTPTTNDLEYSRVVLHEFGHTLGCIHEHERPDNGIPWDKPKVYAYYKQTDGWSKEEVDEQVFSKYDISQIRTNKLDKKSIMMYPVPETLSKGDFSIGWNNGLSDADKKFIAKLYPKK